MAVSRIIKVDLTAADLRSIRAEFSDPTVTEVYIRTSEFDGVPAALVDRVDNRDRLNGALDRIGHQGSPIFRDRLAGAFEVTR